MAQEKRHALPRALIWLADAPLFIDTDQVGRFYDAVAGPEVRPGSVSLELSDEHATALKGKLDLEATLSLQELAAQLAAVFGFIKPTFKADVQAEGGRDQKNARTTTMEFVPITTPQRELITLILHYLVNHPNRVFFPEDGEWRNPEIISAVPRAIAFLDLPGFEEAMRTNRPVTKLIPTAAEFASGRIEQIA